jgi:hypothetical protein
MYHANVVSSYVAPRAEKHFSELLAFESDGRINLLDLPTEGRRRYTDSQWPVNDVDKQKRLIYNMWSPIVDFLDIDAIFDFPASCSAEQAQHCGIIRYNLQTTFVLALDAYIDIRIRWREGLTQDPNYRLPAYPNVTSMDGTGRAFLTIGSACQS